mmetsp:Transcript_681/g.741  ORF Transcript_681/g.741 Transcript_681/m.741 type:complete len:85 (+) Transcript_681:2643-2897(+)
MAYTQSNFKSKAGKIPQNDFSLEKMNRSIEHSANANYSGIVEKKNAMKLLDKIGKSNEIIPLERDNSQDSINQLRSKSLAKPTY